MSVLQIIILFFVSLCSTSWIFRKIHRIAVMKNVVDMPDARKLQKRPVPVLGGLSVFFGIVVSLLCCQIFFGTSGLLSLLALMIVMLCVGTIDDILSLTPSLRFSIEVVIMLLFIYTSGASINDFHGLWGIDRISPYIAVPLTVIAGVGIINAINMIDGVDGLMSGYGVVIMLVFGIFFSVAGDFSIAALTFITAGAMIPFFLHNVFGIRSKMFLGDGGSLMIGTMMAVLVITILREGSPSSHRLPESFGLIPFTLALLSIPVFDCLRVMIRRIIYGKSPFSADRTHLHHMFINLGFSHLGTTISIIVLDLLVLFVWWISYKAGCSIGVQLVVVLAASFLNTYGVYKGVYLLGKHKTRLYDSLLALGRKTHMEDCRAWISMRNFLDREY